MRPARLQRRRAARDAAGAARPRLLAHGPAQVPRRDRRAAHARAVLHRAQHRRAGGARLGPRRRGRCPPSEVAARGVELAAEIAANAPLSLVGNKRVIGELLAARGRARPGGRGGARRAARRLLRLRGLLRGRARVRGEARAALAGALRRRATMEAVRRLVARSSCRCSPCAAAARDAMPIDPPPVATAPRRPADRLARLARASASRSPAGSSTASSCPPRAATSGPTTGARGVAEPAVAALGHRPARQHACSTCSREYRAAHPSAPRVGVADLSRPHGGRFGRNFGGLGHASHQNGLDVDILYPRLDGLERRAWAPRLVDERALAGPRRPVRRRRRRRTCSPAAAAPARAAQGRREARAPRRPHARADPARGRSLQRQTSRSPALQLADPRVVEAQHLLARARRR